MGVFDTITIRGWKIEVSISKDGVFSCEVQGEQVRAINLLALKAKVSDLLSQKDYDIPFLEIGDENYHDLEVMELSRGTIVSVHSGNRNPIVVYDDNRKTRVQKTRHYVRFLKRDTDSGKLKKLHTAMVTAREAYEKFVRDSSLDWEKAVLDAGKK